MDSCQELRRVIMIDRIRCEQCQAWLPVEPEDLGSWLICPACGLQTKAEGVTRRLPPVVMPRQSSSPRVDAWPDAESVAIAAEPLSDSESPTPTLLGLVLLPWLIPLLWFFGPLLTGQEPLFTLAAPTALAVGLSGLGLGISYAANWSPITRIKALLALFLLGCLTAGFLYFLKKEWLEAMRKAVRRAPAEWRLFIPPGGEYRVRMPVPVRPTSTPIADWPLTAYRFVEPNVGAPDVFVVAHGDPPAGLPRPDAWFQVVKSHAEKAGQLHAEREVVGRWNPEQPGREFEINLPDGVTNRIIRAYVAGSRVFYLAAEGPFWRPDTPDVREFFDSFQVP